MATLIEINVLSRAPRSSAVSGARLPLATKLASMLRRMAEARYAQQVERLARSGSAGLL